MIRIRHKIYNSNYHILLQPLSSGNFYFHSIKFGRTAIKNLSLLYRLDGSLFIIPVMLEVYLLLGGQEKRMINSLVLPWKTKKTLKGLRELLPYFSSI